MANKKRTNKSNHKTLVTIEPHDILSPEESVEQELHQLQTNCSGCSNCCGECNCDHSETDCNDTDTETPINRGLDINRRLLIELGINPDMKGYDYIDIGIDLCIKNAVKDVFAEIAKIVGATKGVVSSAIGAAFKKVEPARFDYFWEKYDIALFEKLPAYEVIVNLLAVVAIENDYEHLYELKLP